MVWWSVFVLFCTVLYCFVLSSFHSHHNMNLSCQVQMMPTPPVTEPPAGLVADFMALTTSAGQWESG
jgi:hypothetical protein